MNKNTMKDNIRIKNNNKTKILTINFNAHLIKDQVNYLICSILLLNTQLPNQINKETL